MSRLRIHTHANTDQPLLPSHLLDMHGYTQADIDQIDDADLESEHEWAHTDD